MKKGVVLTLPAGDQVALELSVKNFIENLNLRLTYPTEDSQIYGECYVRQGNIIHGVQWSLLEDGECEIDCSWHDSEFEVHEGSIAVSIGVR